jgi:hypothetical protein
MLPRVAAEAVIEGAEAGVGEVGGIVGAGSQLASLLAKPLQPVGLAPLGDGTLRCVAHRCALRVEVRFGRCGAIPAEETEYNLC